MKVRELNAVFSNGIEARRIELGIAVQGEIAVSLIVGDDQDDIRPSLLSVENRKRTRAGGCGRNKMTSGKLQHAVSQSL